MNKTLSIISMLGRLLHNLYLRLPIYLGVGSVWLVKSSDDLDGVKNVQRWGVVEIRQDVGYYTQYEKLMKVALQKMEKYCTPQQYKIEDTNVTYERVCVRKEFQGMTSDEWCDQKCEYVKFICVEYD